MSLLEQTVEVVGQWGADRAEDRKQCIALLEKVAQNMDAAIQVWEDILKDKPESDNKFTTILTIGPERSKQLYRIYLQEKELGAQLTEMTSVVFKDTLGLMDEIDIVQVYLQVKADETLSDKAQTAINTMKGRRESIGTTLARLQ